MNEREALKLALEFIERVNRDGWILADFEPEMYSTITAIKEALAQPDQEPVAWLITDEKINSLQVDSIQRLIDRAKHAHMTDIKLRINGQDEWYEADWLKHLTRTTTPQREWVGLTEEERDHFEGLHLYAARNQVEAWIEGVPAFIDAIEAKLREKNTYTSPPQRKPLPPQSPCEMTQAEGKMFKLGWLECEAAHGIKGE